MTAQLFSITGPCGTGPVSERFDMLAHRKGGTLRVTAWQTSNDRYRFDLSVETKAAAADLLHKRLDHALGIAKAAPLMTDSARQGKAVPMRFDAGERAGSPALEIAAVSSAGSSTRLESLRSVGA